LDLNY